MWPEQLQPTMQGVEGSPSKLGSPTCRAATPPAAVAANHSIDAQPHIYGQPMEEEEETCLLDNAQTGAPSYSLHQATTSHLDLTDATISQELHAPAGAPVFMRAACTPAMAQPYSSFMAGSDSLGQTCMQCTP